MDTNIDIGLVSLFFEASFAKEHLGFTPHLTWFPACQHPHHQIIEGLIDS